jgi:hypothetical protein
MTYLVVAYLFVLTAVLLFIMLRQYMAGTDDLLSIRNFAVLGFIAFQLTGAAGTILAGGSNNFLLRNPGTTSLIYAVHATVFLLIFFWAYNRASVPRVIARLTPTTRGLPSDASLWLLAVVLLGASVFLRFGISTGLIYNITSVAGSSVAGAACGLAGWLWGRRFLNPMVIAAAATIIIAAAIIVMTGAFGRRGLVALGSATLWGMYYSNLRYLIPKQALTRFALVAAGPLIFVALFSSVRDAGEHDRSAMDHIMAIRTDANLATGMGLLFRGQDAAANSLWLIENYPGDFETRPLFTLQYLAVYMVPRNLWPNKPEPLSTLLPHMGNVSGVNRDRLKLGPGIIGHAAAEGGIPALLIYAFLAGLFIRYLDELVRDNYWSPLVIVALGSTFGQVLGFARGETAAFMALFLIGVVSTYIVMLFIGKLIEHLAGSSVTYIPVDEEPEMLEVEYVPELTPDASGRY